MKLYSKNQHQFQGDEFKRLFSIKEILKIISAARKI